MAETAKVSVAMGIEELRLAKTAAKAEGVSLSAFVTRAVHDRLVERRRKEAARAVLATFDETDFPSPEEEARLLASWESAALAKPPHAPKRKRSKAHAR